MRTSAVHNVRNANGPLKRSYQPEVQHMDWREAYSVSSVMLPKCYTKENGVSNLGTTNMLTNCCN